MKTKFTFANKASLFMSSKNKQTRVINTQFRPILNELFVLDVKLRFQIVKFYIPFLQFKIKSELVKNEISRSFQLPYLQHLN